MANLVVTDNQALGELVVDAVDDPSKQQALKENPVPLLNDAGVRKEINGELEPLEQSDKIVILRDEEDVTHLVIPHQFEDRSFWAINKNDCASLGSLESFVGHYVLQRCK